MTTAPGKQQPPFRRGLLRCGSDSDSNSDSDSDSESVERQANYAIACIVRGLDAVPDQQRSTTVRRILITLAAAALVLGLARPAPATAQESDQARLMRYAGATWASFVAMVDTLERPAHRPAERRRHHRRRRRRRPTSAPTCGARSPPSGSASSATPSWSPG